MIGRARLYKKMNFFDKALADVDKAVSISPKVNAYFLRAEILFELDRYEEALSDFNKGIIIDADNMEARFKRARTHYVLNNLEAALADLQYGLEREPNHSIMQAHCGNILHKLERPDEAIGYLNTAIGLDSKNAFAFSIRGAIFYEKKLLDQALSDLKKAETLDSNDYFTLEMLGRIYYEKKEFDKSLAYLFQVIQHYTNENNADLYELCGDIFSQQNSSEDAIFYYKQALKQRDTSQILLKIAKEYGKLGNFQEEILIQYEAYQHQLTHS
ncbi:MAG: tetratricopeptide repeat protein, partial [Silvanigrellaceae bacterium]|nr:tetratricopeptide repeat protein [Silvanigrellaceae bacterium]